MNNHGIMLSSRQLCRTLASLCMLSGGLVAADWTASSGGAVAGNWSNTTDSGAAGYWTLGADTAASKATANIGVNIAADTAITVDAATAITAALNIGDTDGTNKYTIDGANALSLKGTLAQVSTSAGDTISAPIALTGALTVTNANATAFLTLGSVAMGTNTLLVNSAGPVVVSGPITGTAILTKSGTGTLTLSGANTYVADTVVQAGTVNLTGSLAGTGKWFKVGDAAATSAVLNIISGTSSYGALRVGTNATGTGAVYQSGGDMSATLTGTNSTVIAGVAGGYGYYQLSGGSLTQPELGIGALFNGNTGVMDVAGGTLTSTGYIVVGRGGTTSSGVLNVTGGTVNAQRIDMDWAGTAGAISVLNVANGNVNTTGSTTIGLNIAQSNTAGTLGVANLLSGGVATTGIVYAQSGGATAHLNFNGGTLKAATTNAGANFLTSGNVDAVNVYAAGGTIHNNGTNITFGRPLTAPTDKGVSAIAITAAGSGYVGAPMVKFSGGNGTGATAYATMSGGSITGIVITSPGTGYTAAGGAVTAALVGGGSTSATLGAVTLTDNVATGGMTFDGTGTTTLTAANTYTGPTTVSAGTVTVSGSLASTSAVVASGATLNLTGSTAVAFTNGLSGAGAVSHTGTGSLTIGGGTNGSATGTVTENGGGLTLANTQSLSAGTIVLSANKALTTTGASSVGTITATGTNAIGMVNAVATDVLTVGSLALTGSTLTFELGTNTGAVGASDKIVATTISASGANIVSVTGLSGLTLASGASAVFTLIQGGVTDASTFTLPGSVTSTTMTIGGTTYNVVLGKATATNDLILTITMPSTQPPADAWWKVTSGAWATTTNWALAADGTGTPSVAPAGTTNVTFSTSAQSAATTATLSGSQQTKTITATQTGAVTIDGASATLSILGDAGAGITINGGAGATTISTAGLTLGSSQTWSNASINPLTVSAAIGDGANTYALTKTGSGTLSLSGANTYKGGTILNAGTVELSGSSSTTPLGAGPITFGGAALTTAGGGTGAYVQAGAVTVSADTSVTVALTDSLTLSGAITKASDKTLTKNGTGTLVLSGSSGSYAGSTVINAGTVTLGSTTALGTTSAVTMSSSSASPKLNIGSNATTLASLTGGDSTAIVTGSAVLTVGDATPTTLFAGNIQGTIGLTKVGSGTLTLSGANNSYSGVTTVSAGVLDVTGIVSATNSVLVGTTPGTAQMLVNGGSSAITSTSNSLEICTVSGASGRVLINGGTVNVNGTKEVHIGGNSGGYGVLTMQSGALNCANWFTVSRGYTAGSGGYGIVNVNGGILTKSGNNHISIGSYSGGSSAGTGLGVMDINGGSVVAANGSIYVGENYPGVLHVRSGSVTVNTAGQLKLAANAATNNGTGGVGIVNLNGGTVTVPAIAMGNGTSGRLTFNGGVLKANVATTTFMAGLTGTYVQSGGGTIDNNGNNITIGQALLAPTGNGVSASGLAITGGSGYIDTPIVNITGGGGTGATAVATVSGGAVTGIIITNPGTDYTSVPTFTLIGGGGTGASIGAGTAALVANTSGGLTFAGSGTTILSGVNTYTGATTVNAGTLNVTGSLASSQVSLNGGNLTLASNSSLGNAVVLAGSGTVTTSALTVSGGRTLQPGVSSASAGALAFSGTAMTWGAGGIYKWDGVAAGTAGTNYDTVTCSSLDLSGLNASSTFALTITALPSGFNSGASASFRILTASSAITMPVNGSFVVTDSTGASTNTNWSVVRGDSAGGTSSELWLSYVGTTPVTVTAVSPTTTDTVITVGGSSFPVTVTTSEEVFWVSGSPTLILGSDAYPTMITATFAQKNGSDPKIMEFTATPPATGSYSVNQIVTIRGFAASPTLKNGSGTALSSQGVASGWTTVSALPTWTLRENVLPTVSAVAGVSGSKTRFKTGDSFAILVTMSESVTVTGTPTLTLNIGGNAAYAGYANSDGSANGSATSSQYLRFTYTVVGTETQATTINYTSTSSLALNGGAIVDAAANAATLTLPDPSTNTGVSGLGWQIDYTAPLFADPGAQGDKASGTYGGGSDLYVTLLFNESPLTVTIGSGVPTLTLNSGLTIATYQDTGVNAGKFWYKVGSNDSAAELKITGITMNGSTFTDAAGNAVDTSVVTAGTPLTIRSSDSSTGRYAVNGQADTDPPTVLTVTCNAAAGTYGYGVGATTFDLVVTFSEPVKLTGNDLMLTLNASDGSTFGTAGYVQFAGDDTSTTTLHFTYTVLLNQQANPLTVTGLNLGTSTIVDQPLGSFHNSLTLPGSKVVNGGSANYVIDGVAPTLAVSNPVSCALVAGAYGPNKTGSSGAGTMDIVLTFSKQVYFTVGSPVLSLNTGDGTSIVTYQGTVGSGGASTTHTFRYAIASGDDVATLQVNGLTLAGGGVIRDVAGNTFTPTFGTTPINVVSTNGSTSGLTFAVDTVAPVIASVVGNQPAGTYGKDAAFTLTVTFIDASGLVTATGSQLKLNAQSGGVLTGAAGSTGNLTKTYTYTIAAGQLVSPLAVTDFAGTIVDGAGNAMATPLASQVTVAGSAGGAYVIDAVAPTLVSVTADKASNANGYGIGAVITLRAVFSKAVSATGSALQLGTSSSSVSVGTAGLIGLETSTVTNDTAVYQFTVDEGETTSGADLQVTAITGTVITDTVTHSPNPLSFSAMTVVSSDSGTVIIDGVRPTIASWTSDQATSATTAYSQGASFDLMVTLDGIVTITGTPTLTLNVTNRGSALAAIAMSSTASVSGKTVLHFPYTVAFNDTTSGVKLMGLLGPMSGVTLTDAAGNALAMPSDAVQIGADPGYFINATSVAMLTVGMSPLEFVYDGVAHQPSYAFYNGTTPVTGLVYGTNYNVTFTAQGVPGAAPTIYPPSAIGTYLVTITIIETDTLHYGGSSSQSMRIYADSSGAGADPLPDAGAGGGCGLGSNMALSGLLGLGLLARFRSRRRR